MRSKKEIWKHRKKCDFYRVMEIVSAGVMWYGGIQLAATEELVKAIPKAETTIFVMGIIIGFMTIGFGYISHRLFKGLRIMEVREWKEDERRVLKRAS